VGCSGPPLGSAADRDETGLARRPLPLLGPGMLVLAGRAFDGNAFLAQIGATGAVPFVRAKSTGSPLVLQHLPDGTCLDNLHLRIIEADIAMTGADGTRIACSCWLITTLTGHRAFPMPSSGSAASGGDRVGLPRAAAHPAGGQVLRSGDRPGVEQELWAVLTVCQLLRMAMVTAVKTRPGTDLDRASFTSAPEAARDQLTSAHGICPDGPDGPADLPGIIGRAVLRRPAELLGKAD
jgi:hypothetical protein